MIFTVSLKVLSQMLYPAREKCNLHIRATGIFIMQLELLEIRRLVAFSHNEAPIVAEEPVSATAQHWSTRGGQQSASRLTQGAGDPNATGKLTFARS